MARAQITDYFHSMRFFVNTSGGFDPLPAAEAGFSACTTPEATNEAVEYKEGHFIYTRKYPGAPTMSDITLSRGVALQDSLFYNWMFQTIEGAANYRTDLIIRHFHRDALPGYQGINNPNAVGIAKDGKAARIYSVQEAFCIRCKVAGDLDATASDISISELDIAYEHFSISEEI